MELALALGKTVEELDTMTAVEFELWQKFASVRMLPFRRLELQLAQVSKLIVQTMGGASDVVLEDFLFQSPEDGEDEDEQEELSPEDSAKAFFAFAPKGKKE